MKAYFPEYFGNLALEVHKCILSIETSRVAIVDTFLNSTFAVLSARGGGLLQVPLVQSSSLKLSPFISLWPKAPALLIALRVKTHLSPVAQDAQILAHTWSLFCPVLASLKFHYSLQSQHHSYVLCVISLFLVAH